MPEHRPHLSYRPAPGGGDPAELVLASLGRLQGHLQTLLQTALDKLQAMRSADTAALNDVTQREHETLQKVQRAEQERRAAVARLAQQLHFTAGAQPPLSEIVGEVREPLQSQIRARITGLQALAKQLQEKNRIAALVAQQLQTHVQSVFSAVLTQGQPSDGYGPQGKRQAAASRMIVNALG